MNDKFGRRKGVQTPLDRLEPSASQRREKNPAYVQSLQTEADGVLGTASLRRDLTETLTGANGEIGEAALDAVMAAADVLKADAEQIEEEQEEIPGHIDLTLLDRVLPSNLPELCSIYFAQGKQSGDQWVMADPIGAPGESLRIELSGTKAGHWVNLAASPEEKKASRGKFVQLLMLSRNWTFRQAVTSIACTLGIRLIQPWEEYVLSQKVFYESSATHYWIPHPKGGWIKVTEAGAKRFLQEKGISTKKPQNGLMSPMDRALLTLNQNMNVAYAGPLCGFAAQEMIFHGERVLITKSPQLIKPTRGGSPTIKSILDGLFGQEQLIYFLSWFHIAYETLRSGERRPGQAIALLGPKDCGKTFLIDHLIVPVLAGRVAEPYQYLSGQTTFNAHMFTAEVLKIDDQTAFTDIASRRAFGVAIKRITGNDECECHAKYKQPIMLAVFWRLVIAANDEDENLMILPPIDVSIEDKIMLFRCEKHPMPMATRNLEERKALAQVVRKELPAFCQHLLDWKIPADLVGSRFGVKEFHHPQVMEILSRLSPEHTLLELIAGCLFRPTAPSTWEGSLIEFEKELTADSSPVQHKAKKLFSFNTAARTYLQRLHRRYPKLIQNRHGMHGGIWTIQSKIVEAI